MIKAQGLSLQRGTKVLLQDAQFVINPGERVGVVGRNGAGKSTLFALLNGEIEPDLGSIEIPESWRISVVRQSVEGETKIAREFVIDGDEHLRELQKQRSELSDSDGEKIAELETQLEEAGIWTANSRAEQLLAGLGFSPEQWELPVKQFSGGWQMRLSLARALMSPSDLLLLDEPTNHLDLDAMLWLEKWLINYPGTALIISHDTEFLNKVSQAILYFDQCKLERYKGNYDLFIEQRAQKRRLNEAAINKQNQQIAHMQSFIDRFKAKATKAKQAQSRVKALNRIQRLAPLQQEQTISINLPQPEHMPDPLIVAEELACGYQTDSGPKTILKDIDFFVRGGARIGILGANGSGKTTLVKTIAQELEPLHGHLQYSKGLNIAYFAQQQLDMLDPDSTVIQHQQRLSPDTREQELRNYLGSFGFPGDTVTQTVGHFSGGEKARLALALLVWNKPNLLLMDEPSNHLDVETREALAQALTMFEGSLLLVSHDRHLLASTVDNFWIVADGKLQEFDGDLDDYQTWLLDHNAQKNTPSDKKSDEPQMDRKAQKRFEAEERQRLAQLKKPLLAKSQKLEKELETLESKIAELDGLMAAEDFYDEENKSEMGRVISEHGILTAKKNEVEEEWLLLNEEIEAIK